MNVQTVFRGAFESAGTGATLRVTASNPYKVRLNGDFVWYGPARGPEGRFRLDEVPLPSRQGTNEIEIEVAGYNCNSYYFMNQPSFVQAEVQEGENIPLKTSGRSGKGSFAAFGVSRIRKVNRYSRQRMFGEVYDLPGATNELPLAVQPPVKLLPRVPWNIDFSLKDDFLPYERGVFTYDETSPRRHHWANGLVGVPGNSFSGYPLDELEYDAWDVSTRVKTTRTASLSGAENYPVGAGEYLIFDSPRDRTGFMGLTVTCLKPGTLHVFFDEMLGADGKLDVARNETANTVVWRFARPGTYAVESFEPYTMKFVETVAISGSFRVSSPRLRLYRSGETGRASFRASDPALERIFAASEESLAQNAVDALTDCPSRERAAWCCDSFFIARVAALLSGSSELERQHLENYIGYKRQPSLPEEVMPMTYPANHDNGNYIPNWPLWLILQVGEYERRSGDRKTVEALRPRFEAHVAHLMRFRNADGLLEKLPKWVFVEWSRANKLVQDVNYPVNMLWAKALETMDRLYGRPDLRQEAERVRQTVLKQSWTGRWFCDNAVRRADGTLKLSGECTETCQYYAFYFGLATPKTHPVLWKTLVDGFGPKRLEKNGSSTWTGGMDSSSSYGPTAVRRTDIAYPEIWPANAFIGNYLRLECLSRNEMPDKVYGEVRDFSLYMAEKTGSLWEMVSPSASCCHGFASHMAVCLFRDILGVREIDRIARTVRICPPKDVPIDWCEGVIPVSRTDVLKVRWERTGARPVVRMDLPNGWRSYE